MKLRAFLDTNTFIYAFEFPKSNSRKVIDLLNEAVFEAVISEQVIKEVVDYFRRYYSRELAYLFRRYLSGACSIILSEDLKNDIESYKDKINIKDIEQVVATKKLGLKYLVSFDRDFEEFEEYTIPKKFAEVLGLESVNSEY